MYVQFTCVEETYVTMTAIVMTKSKEKYNKCFSYAGRKVL